MGKAGVFCPKEERGAFHRPGMEEIAMYDVIALGELLVDFAPVSTDGEGYPTLKANPGGAPANFLAVLAP